MTGTHDTAIVPNMIIHTHFLSVALCGDRLAVADLHNVDRAVADVGKHIQSGHFLEVRDNGGIALRKCTASWKKQILQK